MTPALQMAEFHSLGVSSAPDTRDMEYLLRLDRERLIERHAAEVDSLKRDIAGWQSHASDLGNQIRSLKRREDWFHIGMLAVGLFCAYLVVRDMGCSAVPSWFR